MTSTSPLDIIHTGKFGRLSDLVHENIDTHAYIVNNDLGYGHASQAEKLRAL